jgi:GMP synthase (glutamine-hydrolysing)
VATRLLVIQHEDECPPGWFGEWLEAAGVALEIVAGHRGDLVPDTTAGFDGLLVLGGEMGAYDDVPCPWLAPTRRLIARTVAERTPFLGVCLGHQLAGVALGGMVGKNPSGRATGLTPLTLNDVGRADRLLGAVASGSPAVQWNEDVVTGLPPGSSVLAVAPDATVQAARFGPLAWGVQFHPEVSPEIFASWGASAATSTESPTDRAEMAATAAAVQAARAELQRAWRPLAERFGEIVAAAAAPATASTSAAAR